MSEYYGCVDHPFQLRITTPIFARVNRAKDSATEILKEMLEGLKDYLSVESQVVEITIRERCQKTSEDLKVTRFKVKRKISWEVLQENVDR